MACSEHRLLVIRTARFVNGRAKLETLLLAKPKKNGTEWPEEVHTYPIVFKIVSTADFIEARLVAHGLDRASCPQVWFKSLNPNVRKKCIRVIWLENMFEFAVIENLERNFAVILNIICIKFALAKT